MAKQGLSWKDVNFIFNTAIAAIFVALFWYKRSNPNVEKYTPSLAYTYHLVRQKSGYPNGQRWRKDKLRKGELPTFQRISDPNDSVFWNDAADIDSFKLFLLAEMSCVNTPFDRYGTKSDFDTSAGRKRIYDRIAENHGESAKCNCIQEKIEHIMSPNKDGGEDKEFGNVTFALKNKPDTWPHVYQDLIPKINKQCRRFASSFEYKIKGKKMECLIGIITWWCFSVVTLSLHTMQHKIVKTKSKYWVSSGLIAVLFVFIGAFLSFQTFIETQNQWFWVFLLFSTLLFALHGWLLSKNFELAEKDTAKEENVKETNNILTIPFMFTYALAAASNLSFIFTGEKQEKELETLIWTALQILPLTLILTYMTHHTLENQEANDEIHETPKKTTLKNTKHLTDFVQKWIWSIGLILTVTITTTVCQKYNESLATPVRIMQFNTLLIATGILFFFPDLKWKSTHILTAFFTMEQVARLITAFMITVFLLIHT